MTKQLTTAFAAMADPTRRAVVERLTQGPATVSALHAPHDMALPTFMKHLKVLHDAGLVSSEKVGRVRHVTLEGEHLTALENWISRQRTHWEARLDSMAQLAENIERTTS